jgi:acetylornithine/succinyldiaminopimelate/putrescine aminotransferase
MPTEELKQDADRYLMNTYARSPISIVRGRGSKVYDLEGREYLDFVAGIAVNVLGHGHPDLIAAIQKQAQHLLHASNLYYTEPQTKLAKMLVEHSFARKVFFCNSGAEANEAAIKLARRYAQQKYGAERYEIITMLQSSRSCPALPTCRSTICPPSSRPSAARPPPSCWNRCRAKAACASRRSPISRDSGSSAASGISS